MALHSNSPPSQEHTHLNKEGSDMLERQGKKKKNENQVCSPKLGAPIRKICKAYVPNVHTNTW
jgi:hypothetical protein